MLRILPNRVQYWPGSATFAFLAVAPLSFPQENQDESMPMDLETDTLPGVVVIGEALRDPDTKPVSASFLSDEDVANFRIREPQDVTRLTPNLFSTDSGSQSFGDIYSARGLANTVFFGAPAVTIYVDDVPFGETFTYAQQLSAVNSVEVLRGPQPTVVGRNVYGGLINVRSRRPTNFFEGSIDSWAGSDDRYGADGWIMGPIIDDKLHFRAGVQYETFDGYLKNRQTGQTVDHSEHWGFNGGLFWSPAEGWDISLLGAYNDYQAGSPRLAALDRKNFYEVDSDVEGTQSRMTDNQALRISFEDDKVRFLSVTSRRNWDLGPYVTDLDFSPAPIGSVEISQDQEIFSQEFRLSSNDEASPFQWNLGAYGSMSEINAHGLRNIFFQEPRTDFTVTTFAQPVPFPPFQIPLTARSVSESLSDIMLQQFTDHNIDEETFAFFAGGQWSGWEPVTLHAGARVDWVRRSLSRDQNTEGEAVTETVTNTTIDPIPGFPPFPNPPADIRTTVTPFMTPVPHIALDDEWIHVTPTLGIDVDLADSTMAYAKTTYAFKPGGFSAFADDVRFVPFEDEKAWASEIGVKTELFDGALQANVAGFFNSIEDYQVERSFTQTDYAVFNAEEAETYGAEIAIKFTVNPYLDLFGSFGWTHAEFKKYRDPVTGMSLDGNTIPFVPEFDAVIAVDAHAENGLFARLEYTVVGNTTFDDFNRPEFEEDNYGLLNAAVGWRGENASISVFATNLTEEEFHTNINPAVSTGAVGAPSQYGVRVGIGF
jgi:iron complex outermembrane receptor protein